MPGVCWPRRWWRSDGTVVGRGGAGREEEGGGFVLARTPGAHRTLAVYIWCAQARPQPPPAKLPWTWYAYEPLLVFTSNRVSYSRPFFFSLLLLFFYIFSVTPSRRLLAIRMLSFSLLYFLFPISFCFALLFVKLCLAILCLILYDSFCCFGEPRNAYMLRSVAWKIQVIIKRIT
jgi:hypothetical protein